MPDPQTQQTRIIEWEASAEKRGECVVALGVFDGVHLGHQALLRDTVARAREHAVPAIVVTFDRDPEVLLLGDEAPAQLLTLPEKLHYLAETGADVIVVVHFDYEIARMSPEAFVAGVLLDTLRPREVVVGSNFHFGHRACGDVSTLAAIGAEQGFDVVGHDLIEVEGATVSSTRIRALIASGDVAGAARLLGRPHRLSGTVMEGRKQGRELGFPTANVHPLPHMAVPADGVYAGRVTVHDSAWPAAISVGRPPTFEEALPFVECHLIGFAGDLYNLDIEVEFVQRLRDQRAFASLEELTESIAADVAHASEILGGYG